MPAESFYTAPKALEHVTSKMFTHDFPGMDWRDLLPLNTEPDAGENFYAYETTEYIGDSKVAHNYARSAPKVEVKVTKTSGPIIPLLNSFEYDVQDIRNGQVTGRSLSAAKAIAAREFLERGLDELMLVGSAKHDIEGFFNNSAVPSNDVAGAVWASKSPDEKVLDVVTAWTAVVDGTNGIEGQTFNIVLPHTQYMDLATERMADTGMSGLAYLKSAIPELGAIRKNYRLKNISGTDERMVLYTPDSTKLEAILPLDILPHAPQLSGTVWSTVLEARSAGCVIYKPYSMYYANKI